MGDQQEHLEDSKRECPSCKEKAFVGEEMLIPVWQNLEDAERGNAPDYIGCTNCHSMHTYPFDEWQ